MSPLAPVRVVRGEPDEAELAALLASLAVLAASQAPTQSGRTAESEWSRRRLGAIHPQWRWSMHP